MYFENFPTIFYRFVDPVTGVEDLRVVTDITQNVRLIKTVLENVTLYDEYDVRDGETPEIIATNVYGSPFYHWVILLCNQQFHWVDDWPLSSTQLMDFIKAKYTNPYGIHHYENSKGFVVMPPQPGDLASEHVPVTNTEYETRLNDAKRRIKLINPQLLTRLITQFESLV